MKDKKTKKRYIDDLYESKREGGFYTGDGTSHRSKKDVVIRKWHIITGCIIMIAVVAAVFFLISYSEEEEKISGDSLLNPYQTSSTEQKTDINSAVQTENENPWFSISDSGILYFHPEAFEGNHLIIPKRFNGEAVKRLDGESFSHENSSITQLTIHEGLQVIGKKAFSKFTALHTVNLPATLVRVAADSFSGTPWYKDNAEEFLVVGKGVLIKYSGNDQVITLPEKVSVIDGAVFRNVDCKTVIIPDGTTYIGSAAFKDCTAEEIVIPESVQFVESDAFHGCKWLEDREEEFVVEGTGVLLKCNSTADSIRLPDEVVMISGFDLGEQGKDKTLILGANVAKIADLEALGNVKAFKVDGRNSALSAKSGVLYSADGATLYRYPVYKGGSTFYMGDGILKIGNHAFANSTLRTVELYDGLLVVGNSAFKNCKKLKKIALPDTVTELGTFVFEGCESLGDATISESIKILPHGTFSGCKNLGSAALSEGLVAISPFSFRDCESLKYFYVTKNVMKVSEFAFNSEVEFDVDEANKYYKAKNGKLRAVTKGEELVASELVGSQAEKDPF